MIFIQILHYRASTNKRISLDSYVLVIPTTSHSYIYCIRRIPFANLQSRIENVLVSENVQRRHDQHIRKRQLRLRLRMTNEQKFLARTI